MAEIKEKKIFVLDTSVIIYDHTALKNFEEHDVVIPIRVLEELDNFKKGNDSKNFSAREFIRYIDKVSGNHNLQHWTNINGRTHGLFKIELNQHPEMNANRIFGETKNDHDILNTCLYINQAEKSRRVVLVTKDVNLRLKAKSLGLHSEDYETGKIKNPEELYSGSSTVEKVNPRAFGSLYEHGHCEPKDVARHFLPVANHYFTLKQKEHQTQVRFNAETNRLERIRKNSAFRIEPRNIEQHFALDAILNPDISLVTIQGTAGTGKTLLSLAGAIEQRRQFQQIYLARPVVPLSNKDIGFLPGDIKSKLNPYMEPLWDNLKYIKSQFTEREKEYKQLNEMVEQEKIVICPLAYIRGRSLSNVFFIVDEAQNLTPHEVKTIITRAGENTKIVFTGDIYQIDTPYLDAYSNGLSYLIERMKGQKVYAHLTLQKGERSELANIASELL